jgi:hypothetical protein
MATSLKLLKAYGSDSDNESSSESTNEDKDETVVDFSRPIDPSLSLISSIKIDAAPLVLYSVS